MRCRPDSYNGETAPANDTSQVRYSRMKSVFLQACQRCDFAARAACWR